MWKAIKYILIFYAFQLVCALIVMIPGYILKADESVLIIVSLALSSILFCWFIIWKGEVRLNRETFTVRHWIILFLSVVALCFFFLPEVELIAHLSLPDVMEDEWNGLGGSVLGLITLGVLIPISEEMLFRGAVLHSLLDWEKLRSKEWLVILLSAVFFSLFHLNPAQMPGAFLMGLFFGWLCYRTGSLLPGIVVHVFNNSLVCVGMMFSKEEEESIESISDMFASPALEYLLIIASLLACVAIVMVLVREVNKHYTSRESEMLPDDKSFLP